MNDLATLLLKLAITLPPTALALTGAAIATAYAADALGDKTPRYTGRLSANPARHLDPVGTLLLPALTRLMGSPIIFGWAKPVPLNERLLKNPARDAALIALAGVGANFVMALLWAVVVRLAVSSAGADEASPIASGFYGMGMVGIQTNLFFAVFNLLPVPGWAGGHVLRSQLSPAARRRFDDLPPWTGLAVVGVLVFIPELSGLITGPVNALSGVMLKLVGLN